MIKWWYKLFVNFCSAILFNSTSFQVPVFKMSTFTLNIVALFTTALMLLPITKRTDLIYFFMLQHNEERGLSFQTDFFWLRKGRMLWVTKLWQALHKHYVHICTYSFKKTQLLQKRKIKCCITSRWLFRLTHMKIMSQKRRAKEVLMGTRQYYWFLHERNALFFPFFPCFGSSSEHKAIRHPAPLAHSYIYMHLSAFYIMARRLLDDFLPAHIFTKQAQL